MEYVAIVVVAALAQYFWFAFSVAGLRERRGVPATRATDDEELIRAVRVHANTGEMLIIFVPMILLCGHFFHGPAAAGIGSVWLLARYLYKRGYMRDVASRIPGFLLGDAVLGLLALGTLYGAARAILTSA